MMKNSIQHWLWGAGEYLFRETRHSRPSLWVAHNVLASIVQGKLSFVDTLVTRNNGSLLINVYKKSTHTDRYLSPGQTIGNILLRKHCFLYQCFAMFPRVGKHQETLVRNIGKHQMFLNLVGNIFASREANFVSATMFPRVGKHGNIWGNIENHKCYRNSVS